MSQYFKSAFIYSYINIIVIFFLILTSQGYSAAANSKKLPKNFKLSISETYNIPFNFYNPNLVKWKDGILFIVSSDGFFYRFSMDNQSKELRIESKQDLNINRVSTANWNSKYLTVLSNDDEAIYYYKIKANHLLHIKTIKLEPDFDAYNHDSSIVLTEDGFILCCGAGAIKRYRLEKGTKAIKLSEHYVGSRSFLSSRDSRDFYIGSDNYIYEFGKDMELVLHEIPSLDKLGIFSGYDFHINEDDFWLLSKNKLYKLKVVNVPSLLSSLLSEKVFDKDGITVYKHVFSPKNVFKDVEFAWNGTSLWTKASVGERKVFFDFANYNENKVKEFLEYRRSLEKISITDIELSSKSFSWNGKYFTSIVSKENRDKTISNKLVKYKPILDVSPDSKGMSVFKQSNLPIDGFISTSVWIDRSLWVLVSKRVAGKNTMFLQQLKQTGDTWNKLRKLKINVPFAAGSAWDGEFIWFLSHIGKSLYKYKLEEELVLVKKYRDIILDKKRGSLKGLTWDGKYLWAGSEVGNYYKIAVSGGQDNVTNVDTETVFYEEVSPNLIFSAKFSGDGKKGAFRSGQDIVLSMHIKNVGRGVANNIKMVLSGEKDVVAVFDSNLVIGVVKPGETKRVDISAVLPDTMVPGKTNIEISLGAEGGFKSGDSEILFFDIVDINGLGSDEI